MPHWLSNSSPSYLVGFASIWSLQSKTMSDWIASLKLIEHFFCFRLLNIWYIRGSKIGGQAVGSSVALRSSWAQMLAVSIYWASLPVGRSKSYFGPQRGRLWVRFFMAFTCFKPWSMTSIENRRDMLGTLQHPEKLCKIVVASLSHPFSPVEALETDPLTRLCRGLFHPAINQYHHCKRKSIGLS